MSVLHKYVRFAAPVGFILWPKTPSEEPYHSDMVNAVGGRPISAGFATIGETGVRCYGQSKSLDMTALPEDSELLAEQLGLDVC